MRSCTKRRRSFVSETVFSHPSELDLLRTAGVAGYRRYLYVILKPEELAVQRVLVRVETGGHAVPEEKLRARFRRRPGARAPERRTQEKEIS
jgi:predicted ABC-type ATPase